MVVENKLKISNYNCIEHTEISIKPNTLNVKYGQKQSIRNKKDWLNQL